MNFPKVPDNFLFGLVIMEISINECKNIDTVKASYFFNILFYLFIYLFIWLRRVFIVAPGLLSSCGARATERVSSVVAVQA